MKFQKVPQAYINAVPTFMPLPIANLEMLRKNCEVILQAIWLIVLTWIAQGKAEGVQPELGKYLPHGVNGWQSIVDPPPVETIYADLVDHVVGGRVVPGKLRAWRNALAAISAEYAGIEAGSTVDDHIRLFSNAHDLLNGLCYQYQFERDKAVVAFQALAINVDPVIDIAPYAVENIPIEG